jgi:hypothetical protein
LKEGKKNCNIQDQWAIENPREKPAKKNDKNQKGSQQNPSFPNIPFSLGV